MSADSTVAAETLLAHREWMLRLARSLLADDAAAEDAVGETVAAALRSRLRDPRALPAWLATAVRRHAAQAWRSAARRRVHESVTTPRPAPADPAATVARAEAHGDVVACVLALREPYRTAVLLRYFEDLTPAEIAARTGVPLETVRARVRRGVAALRERLAARHAGTDAWRAALVPLAAGMRGSGSAGVAGSIGGAALMAFTTTHVTIAAAALAVGGLTGYWIAAQPASPQSAPATAHARVEPPRDEPTPRRATTDLARLTAENDALRARVVALEAQVATATTSTGRDETEPTRATPPVQTAFVAERFPSLAAVDWPAVGATTHAMIAELQQLGTDADAADDAVRIAALARIEGLNGDLVAAALVGVRDLPGVYANSSFTHPAFVANALAALLQAAEAPLTDAQRTAFERLTLTFCDEVAQRLATYDDTTLALDRLRDESELRRRFRDALLDALDPPRRELVAPAGLRDRLGSDLFGDALVLQQTVHVLAFPEGEDATLVADAVTALDAVARFSQEERERVRRVVSAWFADAPAAWHTASPDAAEPDAPAVRDALARTLDLVRRVRAALSDGSAAARALRAFDETLLPQPRAPR